MSIQITKRIVIAALLLAVCCSQSLLFAGDAPSVKSASTIKSVSVGGKFGGGYKDAKWGMSKDKIRSVIQQMFPKRDKEAIELLDNCEDEWNGTPCFYVTVGEKSFMFYFHKDNLFLVKYDQGFTLSSGAAAEALIKGLNDKYGNGKSCTAPSDYHGNPQSATCWQDGVTTVKFVRGVDYSMYDVAYISDKISALKKEEEADKAKRLREIESIKQYDKVKDDI